MSAQAVIVITSVAYTVDVVSDTEAVSVPLVKMVLLAFNAVDDGRISSVVEVTIELGFSTKIPPELLDVGRTGAEVGTATAEVVTSRAPDVIIDKAPVGNSNSEVCAGRVIHRLGNGYSNSVVTMAGLAPNSL